jgi:hypothetical protein
MMLLSHPNSRGRVGRGADDSSHRHLMLDFSALSPIKYLPSDDKLQIFIHVFMSCHSVAIGRQVPRSGKRYLPYFTSLQPTFNDTDEDRSTARGYFFTQFPLS